MLTGFFHVVPPRTVSILSLVFVAAGAAILAIHLWVSPWFEVGATLIGLGMAGYVSIVGYVSVHTDRRRVGIWGIVLGAVAGAGGVLIAVTIAFGLDLFSPDASEIAAHAVLMTDGLLIGTIIGYV